MVLPQYNKKRSPFKTATVKLKTSIILLGLGLDDELDSGLDSPVALDCTFVLTKSLDILGDGDVLLLNLDTGCLESFLDLGGSH